MIKCIGIGPGDSSFLTLKGYAAIEDADLVAGFETVVNFISPLLPMGKETMVMNYKDQAKKIDELAERHHSGEKVVVVFMGDVHFSGFQLLDRIEESCGHRVETIPGISSAQLLASRARVCFDETTFITFHRRGDIEPFKRHMANAVKDGRNVIVIPRPWDFMPKDISVFLISEQIASVLNAEVWENLTLNEATWKGNLSELVDDFSDMSILLVRTDTEYGWR